MGAPAVPESRRRFHCACDDGQTMLRDILVFVLSLFVFAGLSGPSAVSAGAGEHSWPGTYTMAVGGHPIEVEIAGTQAERVRGLSGRRDLAPGNGLLFVFPASATYGFWMKEMHFPIDIIWIGENRRIVHIAADVAPATFPTVFTPPRPARYVLEMPALSMRKMGVTPGAAVTLPAVLGQ